MKIFIFILLFILNLFSADLSVENEKTDALKKEKLEFIKVSDIPQRASKIVLNLKNIKDNIQTKKEIEDMMSSIKPYVESINQLLKTKEYKNKNKANARKLQKMRNELVIYKKQLQEWESILKTRIELYDNNRKIIKQKHLTWKNTYKNAIKEKAPKSIRKTIKSVILELDKLLKTVKIKYDRALTNSQIVTTNSLIIQEISKNLRERELVIKNMIFYQNQSSYFKLLSDENFSFTKYFNSIQTTIEEKTNEIIGYFQTHYDSLLSYGIFSIFSIFIIVYISFLYKKKELFIREESYDKKEFFFIKNIFSTIIIALMLGIIMLFPDIPLALKEMQTIILIIPVIRILQTIMESKDQKNLFIFFTIFILFFIDKNSNSCDLESRTFVLFINITLIGYLLYMIKQNKLALSHNTLNNIFKYSIFVSLFVLFVAFISNLYGSVLLSSRIIDSVFMIYYSSLAFYVFYLVLNGYTIIALRKRISSTSYTLKKYSQNIEKTTRLFIKIWMISWWILTLLKLLGLYIYFIAFKDSFLLLSWEVGQTVISVKAIVDFIFILFITFVFAKVLKIFLELEIFSRFKFPRGLPTAILTTLNYLIIISGTILAFSSLGVTTQQFALVIGALGVGIGFGLRNIIANFVSGIIMVFERPIQIGDTIEVDNTMGDVQSIGARSSTLKTFDGAEVIIPNADFIAKEITNWTLSDKRRRKIFEFKVALDNDVDKVIGIMQEIASKHKQVLKDPAPLPTFQGFGEYYLSFRLYFWLSDYLLESQSEIATQIYARLKEEGIKMPVPSTELKRK